MTAGSLMNTNDANDADNDVFVCNPPRILWNLDLNILKV